MDKYFIKALLLEGCSYSIATHELIKNHQIPADITWIEQANKENYKNELINTFPQIYLKKINNNGNLLLGGYTELEYFISTFLGQKISETNINNWIEKTKWSKKSTLRLIQLVNKIN
jgi:glutaredoxin